MKLTFASEYSRKSSQLEYPLEVYCYGNFEIKSCDYYNEDCPKSCSYAKAKDTLESYAEPYDFPSISLHSFKTGLERFIQKWGDKWKR